MDLSVVSRRQFIHTSIILPICAFSLPSFISRNFVPEKLCLNRLCVSFERNPERFDKFLTEPLEWEAIGTSKEWQGLYDLQIQEQVRANKLLGSFREVFHETKTITNVTLWSSREDMVRFQSTVQADKVGQAIVENRLNSTMESFDLALEEAQILMKNFGASKNLLEYFANKKISDSIII